MDKIIQIINAIRGKDVNDKKKLILEIKNQFYLDLKKNMFTDKDISFLIDIVLENENLSNEIIGSIFLNSKKKVEHKIVVPVENHLSYIPVDETLSNLFYSRFIDIFTTYGQIFIKPPKLVLLVNKKMNNKTEFDNPEDYFNSVLFEDDNHTKLNKINSKIIIKNNQPDILVKYIDYNVFENQLEVKKIENNIFDNNNRKFGLQKSNKGIKTKYHLVINYQSSNIYTSINEIYKGSMTVFFNGKKHNFIVKTKNDVIDFLDVFKNDMLELFEHNPNIFLKLNHLFLKEEAFSKSYPFFLTCLSNKNLKRKKRQEISDEEKLFISKELIELNEKNFILQQESCPHERLLTEYITDKSDFFAKINSFIEDYVNYEDGLAYCKLCNELITTLSIQGKSYSNDRKYVANVVDNVLNYHPYNKFDDISTFFENIFYHFNYYTKLTIGNNNNQIIRLVIDNLIFISSNRLELEEKLKTNILNDEIFLLRLSNNFFQDNVKEKFKEKKEIFTHVLIFLFILIVIPIRDYNEFIFLNKKIKLTKWKTDVVSFEQTCVLIIDFLLKYFKFTYWSNITNDLTRLNRIMSTVNIYLDIMNEEAKVYFEIKKKLFDSFLLKKKNEENSITIPAFENYDVQPQLDFDNKLNYLLPIKYFRGLKRPKEEMKIFLSSTPKFNYTPKKYKDKQTSFKENELFLNFNDFNPSGFNKEVADVLEKFNKKPEIFELKNKEFTIRTLNKENYFFNEENVLIEIENASPDLTFKDVDFDLFRYVYGDTAFYKKQNISTSEVFNSLINYIEYLSPYITIKHNLYDVFLLKDKESIDRGEGREIYSSYYIIFAYKKFIKETVFSLTGINVDDIFKQDYLRIESLRNNE